MERTQSLDPDPDPCSLSGGVGGGGDEGVGPVFIVRQTHLLIEPHLAHGSQVPDPWTRWFREVLGDPRWFRGHIGLF